YEMAYDDAGDFHPRDFDALLRPDMRSDGTYAFTWMQSGAMLPATRFGPRADFAQPSPAELAAYAGTYPLAPGFELSVREEGGRRRPRARARSRWKRWPRTGSRLRH